MIHWNTNFFFHKVIISPWGEILFYDINTLRFRLSIYYEGRVYDVNRSVYYVFWSVERNSCFDSIIKKRKLVFSFNNSLMQIVKTVASGIKHYKFKWWINQNLRCYSFGMQWESDLNDKRKNKFRKKSTSCGCWSHFTSWDRSQASVRNTTTLLSISWNLSHNNFCLSNAMTVFVNFAVKHGFL